MPEITQIKPQKNNNRVNIYLDGKFGFGLDLENYLKLNLKVGQDFTETEIEEIVKKAEFQKTLDKLLRFATLRPRSKKEINNWLKKYKVHISIYKKLFNRLKRLELVDDEKFARWWIGQRMQFKYKSKKELMGELKYKGIDKYVIEDIFSELINEDYEITKAKLLLENKLYKWRNLDKNELKQKMSIFLIGKGFDWTIVRSVVDDLISKR